MDIENFGSLFGGDDSPKQNNHRRKKKKQKNKKQNKNKSKNVCEAGQLKNGKSRKLAKKRLKLQKKLMKQRRKALSSINFEKFILKMNILNKTTNAEETYNVGEILQMIKDMPEIEDASHLIAEDDYGNTEYKLKLVDKSIERVQHLTSQMKFRLEEGLGEAFYNLGYEDDGNPLGIGEEELACSLKTLSYMAQNLKADFCINNVWKGIKGIVIQAVVRKYQRDGFKPEVRISLLGDFESGKSTLLGVLTSGKMDDGKGLARLSILNHKHELISGVTSSHTYAMLGFDSEGNVIKDNGFGTSFERIFDQSHKIMSFFDSAGHQKYSKSIIHNFMTNSPDYGMLVVNPLAKLSDSFKEYFRILTALQIPSFIVITNMDRIDEEKLNDTLDELRRMKRKVDNKLHMMLVRSSEDVVFFGKNINEDLLPVFAVSNVNGMGIRAIQKFLNVLPVTMPETSNNHKTKFLINNKFFKDDLLIITGAVQRGKISKRQKLFLGPDSNGNFKKVEVTSIHCYKVPVRMANCGQTCSLAIREVVGDDKWIKMFNIKKGMMLVESFKPPKSSVGFVAEFSIFDESEEVLELPPLYEPVVTSETFKQTCYIISDKHSPEKKKKVEIPEVEEKKSLDDSITTRENSDTKSISFCTEDKVIFIPDSPGLVTRERRTKSRELTFQQMELQNTIKVDSMKDIKRKRKYSHKVKRSTVVLKGGEKVVLSIKFKYNPEFLSIGQKVIICDQKTKAIGIVKKLIQ